MDHRATKPPSGGFVISGSVKLLRTIAYIDGFNLYYGCLKREPHCRWLDVAQFTDWLISEATNEPYTLTSIKYFTAPVLESLSPNGDVSRRAQSNYIRALEKHCPNIEIIYGFYSPFRHAYFADEDPIDFTKKHRVVRPEEKQTDVNVSIHMISDAYEGNCDQQVLVGNDSDHVPPFQMIREKFPSMTLGLIAPLPIASKDDRQINANKALNKAAHWSRWPISTDILEKCQLPERIPTSKKPITRPAHWKRR